MEAFEFQTTVQEGVIKIPEKLIKKLTRNIKVIIMTEEENKVPSDSAFPYFAIDTTGYKFNREEANER